MTPEPLAEEFCPWVETTVEEVEREVAKYANDRRLSPNAIGELAQRMIDSPDPAEQDRLWEAIMRGWYGGIKDA